MIWQAFESAAPEMATFGKERFEGDGVAHIATIRRDGSPRISCVLPFVMDGELYLGMLWRSRKALDLLRDPRLAIRNAICTNTGKEVELTLRGGPPTCSTGRHAGAMSGPSRIGPNGASRTSICSRSMFRAPL